MKLGLALAACMTLAIPALAQTPAPTAAAPTATPANGTVPTAAPATAAPPGEAASPPPAFNVRTTRDLVGLCNTPTTDPSYPGAIGLCVGYGSGVLDYHLADTYGRKRARKVCLPQQPPTRGEARQMFVAWAQAHEQYMDEPAVEGVMRFLISTFPCGKGR